MKILKAIVLLVIGLVALILIVALFVDKKYAVDRSVVINKPKAQVFDYIKSLKSQNDWSVWGKKDPNMTKEFTGTDGTVGCISKWKGNKDVGEGEQEIKKIIDGQRIETELRFKKPFEATNQAHFITEAVNDSTTKVTWGFEGSMPYPMNFMKVFMNMDKMIGKYFEEGLSNLKNKLEHP